MADLSFLEKEDFSSIEFLTFLVASAARTEAKVDAIMRAVAPLLAESKGTNETEELQRLLKEAKEDGAQFMASGMQHMLDSRKK